jgi:multidrug resistance efflux pump
MIPVTNNAFVVTNITPIAADVAGYITNVYVKNGEHVKKNTPLIEVYPEPYRLAYAYAKSKYEEAIAIVHVIEKKTAKTADLLKAATFDYEKARLEYQLKNASSVRQAIPALKIRLLHYQLQAIEKKKRGIEKTNQY